jgi:hypothetical protein
MLLGTFGSVNARLTPLQSIPVWPSPSDSELSLVCQNVRSSSVKKLLLSGLEGKKKNMQMASTKDGRPSMRNKIRHVAMDDLI